MAVLPIALMRRIAKPENPQECLIAGNRKLRTIFNLLLITVV